MNTNRLRKVFSATAALCAAAVLATSSSQTTTAAGGLPRPDHVVIVIEENHAFQEIFGSASAPMMNSLIPEGALFTQSFAVEHPSEPNYLDFFSGSNQGVTDDSCPHSFSTPNLAAQLFGAGLSFGGYSEDLPAIGSTVCSSGSYFRKHNPWVNFNTSPNAVPTSANKPFIGSWPTTDAGFAALPTVSIVVPNQLNDMHDGSIAQGDAWFWNNLSPYYQWTKTHNSLLILTFDEDDSSASNQIFTLFLGPMVAPGSYSTRINHFNILRTLEDMYGLGYAGAAATATPITSGWKTSLPGSTTLGAQAGNAQVSLSWTVSGGAQTYNLYRGTAANGEALLQSGLVGTGYVDTAVTNGTTYYYKVAGANGNGEGILSNEASAKPSLPPPAAPTNLVATPGSLQVTLGWTNHATAATSIALERRQGTGSYSQIATVAPTATGYVNTGLKRRTTYTYRVRTLNGTLASSYSNTASARTP